MIRDPVVHDATARPLCIEAMFMLKQSEWTFHDFIHQQMRPLHRFPSASPTHRNDPPIAAMQFNHAPFLSRSIGFQANKL